MNRQNIEAIYKLTPMQQGMLMHTLMAPESAAYFDQFVFPMVDGTSPERLVELFEELVSRHDILRTSFLWGGKLAEPVQVVHKKVEVESDYLDWSDLAEDDLQRRLQALCLEDRQRGFDMKRAPLMRLKVVRTHKNLRVVWSYHHILLDGWSAGNALKELFGRLMGKPASKPPRPFRDYVGWLQTKDPATSDDYWKRILAGFDTPTPLPFDKAQDAVGAPPTGGFERNTLMLPADVESRLQNASRASRATPFSFIQTAWALTLSLYSGQRDVVFGITLSGRPAGLKGVQEMLGCFINTLPVRIRLQGRQKVKELIAGQQKGYFELLEHEHSHLTRAQQQSDVGADQPLFESILVSESFVVGRQYDSYQRTNYPLTVMVRTGNRGTDIGFGFDLDRFDPSAVQRLHDRLVFFLEVLVDHLEEPLESMPLVSEAERQQLLVEWDGRPQAFPLEEATIHGLVARMARQYGERVALLDGVGTSVTYGQLEERANRLAHHLQDLGVGPERLVGVCMERSCDLVVALLAVLKAGGAYLPLDLAYPEERLAFMLEDAQARWLISTSDLAERLPDFGGSILHLDSPEMAGALASQPSEAPSTWANGDSLAYVIYTSGSTGRPKGVLIPHRNVARLLAATDAWFRFGPEDCWTFFHSHAFDFSVWEIWGALATSGRVVAVPYWVSRSPEAFYDLLRDEGVTVLNQTPSAFRQLVEVAGRRSEDDRLQLREVIFGGEALDLRALAPWYERYADDAPRLVNMYGITETTVHVTYRPLAADEVDRLGSPVGRAIPDLSLHVLDDAMRPLPVGVAGELFVGGAGVARGYLGRPALTAQRFVPDPYSETPGARLYRSGDLARYEADGDLDFLGRIDHQVKIRGFRIELGEIESALEDLPSVRQAVVLALPGSGNSLRLVAYLIPEGEVEISGLRAALGDRLPDYMVPSAFVSLDAFPLTANGKLDRKALPAPEEASSVTRRQFVAPRTETEKALATIWGELLQVEQVGVEDHFFELGGHSLVVTQVASRIRQAFEVDLSLPSIFDRPLLADLALEVDMERQTASQRASAPPLESLATDPADRLARLAEGVPLSFAQERLWFLDQLMPGRATYNIPGMLRLRGPLDADTFRQALREIVRRHEILRSSFTSQDGKGRQHVQETVELPIPLVDLSADGHHAAEAKLKELAAQQASTPFDLSQAPLMRVELVKLADGDHAAVVVMHHVVSDGWSLGVLLRELQEIYDASAEGRAHRLPELAVQYADFADWQRRWLESGELDRQMTVWKARLEGAPTVLELPTDRPAGAAASADDGAGGLETTQWPRALQRQLEDYGRKRGVTPFMVVLATFQALLGRLSGQDVVLVGSPIANRTRMETEGLIGFFVNTLVLRGDLDGGPTFEQLFLRSRETTLEAYAHQDVPFEKLVDALAPERSLDHSPLFQVLFSMQKAPAKTPTRQGLVMEPMGEELSTAKFHLNLALHELEDGVVGLWSYPKQLFDGATVRRFGKYLETLLRAALTDDTQCIDDVSILTASERHQLLVEWNEPRPDYVTAGLVHELVMEVAAQRPEAVALALDGTTLSYGELASQSAVLARHLRTQGVGPDSVVGVCLDRCFAQIVSLLAVLRAGGAYLPLDPSYPSERLAYMVQDSGAKLVLSAAPWAERFADEMHVVRVDPLLADGLETAEGPFAAVPGPPPRLDNVAYVIYTSGSTGKPKGVVISHRAMRNRLVFDTLVDADATCCYLQFSSIGFDMSMPQVFTPLLTGGRVAMLLPDRLGDPDYLKSVLENEGVTHVGLPPVVLEPLLASLDAAKVPKLRRVVSGGEALGYSLAKTFYERLPDALLMNRYGPTEATVGITSATLRPGSTGRVPIGRPIAKSAIYLVDSAMRPVPPGAVGELMIGGLSLARGYLDRPALTAERFIPNPFPSHDGQPAAGRRLYRTGDLARWRHDGALEFMGRVDQQVKIRGFRVELGEIESRLRAHPALAEAAVVDLPDGATRRLAAYLVAEGESVPSRAELKAFLADDLPDYMVPSAFVTLEAIPLTPSGKLDRRSLPSPDWGGSQGEPPQGEMEERLASVFAQVLGIGSLGRHDDFFDLGGHSLLATQVVARLRQVEDLDVPLRLLFEAPTVAALAARLEGTGGAIDEAPPLVALELAGKAPRALSHAQERLWFIDHLLGANAVYNLMLGVRLRGDLQIDALQQALDALAARHEAFRSRFPTVDGQAQLVVDGEPSLPIRQVDLSHLEPSAGAAEAHRLAREEALRPFDLRAAPLIRVTLWSQRGENDAAQHDLLLVMHHIISDGWSMQVLLRELATLYRAAAQGDAVDLAAQLAPMPIQYSDFAAWQRGWLSGEVLEGQLDYWRHTLEGSNAVLELPTDRPRPAISGFAGASINDRLSRPQVDALEALAKSEGSTLFMALLAAFQVLLSRLSGQLDVNVGTPIANRQRMELEGLVGFFVNTLVLRGRFEGSPTFRQLLERTREATLGAYAHQDVPFEKLVGELAPDRDLAQNSLFQVLFTLQAAAPEPIELPGLVLEQLPPDAGTSQFDLTLTALERPWGLDFSLSYKTELFDAATAERWLGHLKTLMVSLVESPDRPVVDAPWLTDAERHQLLVEWDGRPTVPPSPSAGAETIHGLVAQWAIQDPSRWALLDGSGNHLTYGELEARANQLAHRLQHLGAGPERLVGLCLERSMDLVVALLAVLKSGAAYLPLDVAYPQDRLAFMLDDSDACLLISNSELQSQLPPWDGHVILLDDEAEQERLHELPSTAPETPVGGDHLAYVIYTSGSTGRPKGVLIPHCNAVRLLAATQEWFHFGPDDTWTFFHSHAFDFSVWEIWGALATGGRLVAVPYWVSRSPQAFYELLRDEKVTVLNQTPSAFRQLVEVACAAPPSERLALREVIFGGEALDLNALAPWFERYGDQQPRLVNMYGITETTVHVTYRPLTVDDLELSGNSPVGQAIPDLSLQVLDHRGRPQPIGVPGEIHVGGSGLARGYLGRPALTAERFVPDPYGTEPGARLYRSGDLARYLVDGDLDFLGRIDHQVKIRGFRIELGEIEAALEDLASVQRAVVLAVPASGVGGDLRLVAYLQETGDGSLAVEELRQSLEERLPTYMVPAAFVPVTSWPLTANGKLDRRALPDPEAERLQVSGTYQAPRDDVEAALAEVWQGVLGVERVGVHDNFFELGGDSILSIQVISRAKMRGLELQPQHIFQQPTIAGLAQLAGETVAIEAEQGPVTGELPLGPVQRHFFSLDLAQPAHYNQAFLLSVPSLDPDALQRAVVALMDHHDQLRVVFPGDDSENGSARQEILPLGLPSPCTSMDLSTVVASDRQAALEAAVEAAQGSFDLATGPLLKVVHFHGLTHDAPADTTPSHPDRLLIVAHHLVIDGVSWRIVLEDLERAYQAEASGQAADLGLKTTSFKAWTQRLETWAAEDRLASELPYWNRFVEQPPATLPVDLDGPQDRNVVASADSVSVHLGKSSTEALLRRVPAAYRTQINDVLLTVLTLVLAEWTGERRQGVILEGHGREDLFDDVDTSRTVGWFTSLFPVLLELPADDDLGSALKAVKEQLRVLPRRGIGYGALRFAGPPEVQSQLAQVDEPQVSFNYLGQVDLDRGQEAAFFIPAEESSGRDRAPSNRRDNLIDVTVGVAGGGARISWIFSDQMHRRETIEGLANAYLERLEDLIAHCTADGAGGFTPSDFPLAGLDQTQLDTLFAGDREVEDVYPLSPLQKGLLVHTLAIPGRYFEQMRVGFRGDIDVDRFRRAWDRLLERHTILRSAFLWRDLDEPLQVVRRHAAVEVQSVDWRHLPVDARQEELQRFLAADRRRGFVLEEAPLLRLHLLRLDDEHTWIIFSHHHLLLDGWSTPLLLREVFASYAALAGEEAAAKALGAFPPVRPFGEYIAWLQHLDLEAQEQFWRRYLDGFEDPTPLLASRREKALLATEDGTPPRGIRKRLLPPSTLETLQSLTHRHKVTLNTLLQGLWALMLGRATAEEDVVFGATVSGRNVPLEGMEHMLGMFINTLPVRVPLRADQPVHQWLEELQAQQGEASQFEHSSLMDVQSWSAVRRPKPLFESILVFENYPVGGADQMGDLGIQEMGYYGGSDYPLALVAVPRQDLSLSIGYDVSRFDDATVERAMGHLVAAVEGFIEHPTVALRDLPLLTATERHQLLVEWNRSDVEHTLDDPLVHRPVWRQAAATPERPAVIYDGHELSYGELTERARQLARDLRRRGVGPEDVVAVHMERSFELIVAYLAVMHAGAAYLPLDPGFPGDRLGLMARDADVDVLLTHGTLQQDWLPVDGESTAVHVQRLETIRPGSVHAPVVSMPEIEAEIEASGVVGEHPAYVIYTSGSTGKPKGVVVTHRSVANRLAYDRAYDVDANTRYLQNTAVGFDMSVPTIFSPLWVGGCTVLVKAEQQQDPKAILRLMAKQRVNRAGFPPQMLSLMLEDPALDEVPEIGFIGSGGDAVSADLPRRFYERLPDSKLLNRYGPTEATVAVTSWLFPQHDDGDGPPPIGRPMAGAHIDLVDRWFQPVPVGVPGELVISGVCLARGYLGDPARTAERFVPNPFARTPGERVYRTGDLARHRPDGAIEFLGRIDHQVKIRGFRVELGEIEAQLVAHAAVRRAAVIDVGSGDLKQLVAYVVPQADQEVDADALAAFLGDSLPDYMVPSAFVPLDELPVSRTGKVDRKQLPEPSQFLPTTPYVEPQGPWQVALARLFAEVLERDRVGAADDFFALGGHSLMAARVVARLRRDLGVDLPLGDLFAHPRVDALAQHLDVLASGGGAEHDPVLLPLKAGSGPALFCVHPVAGVALCYRDLAAAMDADQTLIGIQSPALRGEATLTEVDALATRYLEAVRAHQPEGPYELAGWSFGGLVAYEMARQLRAAGEHVTFLGLFDAVLAESKDVNQDLDDVDRLMEAFRQFLGARADALEGRLAGLESSERRAALEAWLAENAADLEIGAADLDRYVEVQKAHEAAFRGYRPQPYDGAVAFFEAETRTGGVDDPVAPWRDLAAQIDVYGVSGSHDNMVFAPHSEILATALEKARRSEQVTSSS